MEQKKIEVCLSPALFSSYFLNPDTAVVVIDVFRATSAICTAFDQGVKEIIPVATIEEARSYKKEGFMVGAERNGEIVEGFDFGNSPFSYMKDDISGKRVVLTTTNGTKAINIAKNAECIVVGSFLNLEALANYLIEENRDVLLLCAGWKNRFNMEDTLFAGAMAARLMQAPNFGNTADSTLAAMALYDQAKDDLFGFLENSSHRRRLHRLQLEKDIAYCLQLDQLNVVPVFRDGALIDHAAKVSVP